jgi:hypothetical protein
MADCGGQLRPEGRLTGRFRHLRRVKQAGMDHDDAKRLDDPHGAVVDRHLNGHIDLTGSQRPGDAGGFIEYAEEFSKQRFPG